MKGLPQGFINEATKELEFWLCQDRNAGGIRSCWQYFVIAAEVIWEECVARKNQDASVFKEDILTENDIASECYVRGIDFKFEKNAVIIPMTNMTYRFYSPWNPCIGGPIGEDGKYYYAAIDSPGMHFSTKELFNLMEWFDSAILNVEETIRNFVDRMLICTMQAKMLQAKAQSSLEPGLEDIPYKYSFSAGEDGSSCLYIWIYLQEDSTEKDIIRLTFTLEEFEGSLIFIKHAVRDLYRDTGCIGKYSKWARRQSHYYNDCPIYSDTKSAGVCVSWQGHEIKED